MKTLFRVLGYLVYFPLLALFLYEFIRICGFVYANYTSYYWFLIGIGAYLVLGLFFRKNRKWLQTFSHELTHTLVGMLYFRKIHSFTAERGEGVMSYTPSRYNIGAVMISLSPYFLPIFTIFLLLIRHMIAGDSVYIFDILIGFTFAFHLGCFIAQTGSYQTDLQKHGLFFSYLVIATWLTLNVSLVVLSIYSNLFPVLVGYFKAAWVDLVQCATYLWAYASELIATWMA